MSTQAFIDRFQYELGSLFDGWRFVETKGDCNDFVLTVLYHECGQSRLRVFWAILTCQAIFWHVASPQNKGIHRIWGRHTVLKYKGRYVDSTDRRWRSTVAPHSKRFPKMFLVPFLFIRWRL